MSYNIELLNVEVAEKKLINAASKKKPSVFDKKIEQYVPDTLEKTLKDTFELAFRQIFQNGTGIISATFDEESPEEAEEMISKSRLAGMFDTGMSFVSGTGMGLLGIGLPDIPIFTAMVLRNIYQSAVAYGFDYRSRTEQVYILMLIEGALAIGDDAGRISRKIDAYSDKVDMNGFEHDSWLGEELDRASNALADSMLYMKFVQGMPIVGAAGGFSNASTMRKISKYVDIKYHKRKIILDDYRAEMSDYVPE
ncbi:MAG: EcsC family protein [Firmicutes bacterium]|nr:EcsC family protein [Bacillota bacterium]